MNWNDYGLILAEVASWKSKDPSTKVGAAIVSLDHRILGMGFNGFPRGVDDNPERYADRPTKYSLVAHAERNAMDLCEIRPAGATLYINKDVVCNECAKSVIQRGIARVVVNEQGKFGGNPEHWLEQKKLTRMMFEEAGVEYFIHTMGEEAQALVGSSEKVKELEAECLSRCEAYHKLAGERSDWVFKVAECLDEAGAPMLPTIYERIESLGKQSVELTRFAYFADNHMIKLNGKGFRCGQCNSNVFTLLSTCNDEKRYRCNGCREHYIGE